LSNSISGAVDAVKCIYQTDYALKVGRVILRVVSLMGLTIGPQNTQTRIIRETEYLMFAHIYRLRRVLAVNRANQQKLCVDIQRPRLQVVHIQRDFVCRPSFVFLLNTEY